MTQQLPISKVGQHFAAVDLGSLSELKQYRFESEGGKLRVEGKLFLNRLLDLTSSEISFNSLAAEKSVPFYHKHRLNEEIYIFLKGQGEFQVDDQSCWVREGTVLRVDPEGVRRLHNRSTEQDLVYLVIQARANSYSDHTIQDGVLVQP